MLKAALAEFKPELVSSYTNIIRHQFARMAEDLGPKLRDVVNSWSYARIYTQSVRPNLDRNTDGVYSINEDRLATNAINYAEAVIEAWEAKITGKMVELEEAKVERLDGGSFNITGTKQGHQVQIIQQTIVNVSSQGKVFNQFPARIKVDGKATSEAAYKRMFK